MRALGIDYGDARVGIAITDPLGYTAQGLETIHHQGNDKIVLKRLEEILAEYNNEIDTFAIGMPLNMNGTKTDRVEVTEKFIHKLQCPINKPKESSLSNAYMSFINLTFIRSSLFIIKFNSLGVYVLSNSSCEKSNLKAIILSLLYEFQISSGSKSKGGQPQLLSY